MFIKTKNCPFPLMVTITALLILSGIFTTSAPIPSDFCLYFNGNMSVSLPNSFDFDRLSVVMWANSQNTIQNIQTLWANRIPGCNMGLELSNNPSEGIAFFMNEWRTNDRQLLIECYNDTGLGTYGCSTYESVENLIPSYQWIHLALTSERNGDAFLYLNGEQLPNTAPLPMQRVSRTPFNYSTLGQFIPAYVSGLQSYGFQGLIHELTFWNTTLSPDDINTLMSNNPLDQSDPNLISYYNFNLQSLADAKSHFHGTNNGYQLVQYTQVALSDTCGDNIVEPQFGEQCDGGEGCVACKCDTSSGYLPYSPPRLDCSPSPGHLMFGVAIAVVVVSVASTVPMICSFFFFLYHRNARPITGATPVFCFLSLFGTVLLAISPIFLAQGIVFSCMAAIWFWGCGFILLFGSIVVKTWRIHRLFHTDLTKFICITDKELIMYLAVLFFIEIAILIVWTVLSPLVPPQNLLEGQLVLGCQTNSDYLPIMVVQLAYAGLLLIAGCILAFKVRNVPLANVREGKEILFSVYNFTILLILIGSVVGSISSLNTQVLLILVGLELAIILSSFGLFWSKIYKIVMGKDLWKIGTASRATSVAGTIGTASRTTSAGTKSKSDITAEQ